MSINASTKATETKAAEGPKGQPARPATEPLPITKAAGDAFVKWEHNLTYTGPALMVRFLQAIGAMTRPDKGSTDAPVWQADAVKAMGSMRGIARSVVERTDPGLRGEWVGWETKVPSAAAMAAMSEPERAYWTRVNRVADRIKYATEDLRPKAPRATRTSAATATSTKGKAGTPAATGKAASVKPDATVTPPKPDADALRVAVEQIAAGGTAGLTKAGADKVRKAITSAAPASPKAAPPADLTDPRTLASALGVFVANGQRSDALAAIAREYLIRVCGATVTLQATIPTA